MLQRRLLLLFVLFSLLGAASSGCAGVESDSGIPYKTVKVNGKESIKSDFFKLCDTAYFEPLLIPDSVVFGRVTSLKRMGEFTCLSSVHTNSLVCFEDKKLLYHLSKIGGGVGEYMVLHAFLIDTLTQELLIYDRQQLKICYYGLRNGKFKRETKLKSLLSNIEIVDKNHFLISVDYDGKNYVRVVDRSFSTPTASLNTEYPLITDAVFPSSFSYIDTMLYYVEPFTETIYQVRYDGISPFIHFDFGTDAFPQNFWKNANTEEVEEQLSRKPYAFMVHLLAQENNLTTFFHYYTPTDFRLVKYNQKNSTIKQFRNISEEFLEGTIPLPTAVYQNTYLKVVYSDALEQDFNLPEWKRLVPPPALLKKYPPKTIWLLNYHLSD